MDARQSLSNCQVFCALNPAELERIESMSSFADFPAGATVFTEGTPSQHLYILESGKIALQMQLPSAAKPAPGRRVSVDIVTRNEVFGWSSMVEPYRYTMMAVCLEPSRVLAVDAPRLRALLEQDKKIGFELFRRLIAVVASRLEETRHVLIAERLVSA